MDRYGMLSRRGINQGKKKMGGAIMSRNRNRICMQPMNIH
jgi:hypothetical protein